MRATGQPQSHSNVIHLPVESMEDLTEQLAGVDPRSRDLGEHRYPFVEAPSISHQLNGHPRLMLGLI